MSIFNSYEGLMGTATTELSLAAIPLPPVFGISLMVTLSKGNPVNLDEASQAWGTAADNIESTKTMLQERVASISTQDWDAKDRKAYEAKVQEFVSQLECMQMFCKAVSIALMVFAIALMVFAVFAVAMGTFLAVLAVTATASLAGVVTAGAYAACVSIAGTCVGVTAVATGILAAAGSMAAMVFQGGSMLSMAVQTGRGNDQAMGDFMDASVTASQTALANLGQNAANAALSVVDARKPDAGGSWQVDLDHDRNADDTWTTGGGATYTTANNNEFTGGGHVQHNEEHGIVGGDVNAGVETDSGWSADVNAGYTDEDGFGQGDDGTLNYGASGGYENEQSGWGGSGGIEGEHDFETGEGTVSGTGTGSYNGQEAGYTQNVNYNGDGDRHYSGEVTTPVGNAPVGDETPPWDQ